MRTQVKQNIPNTINTYFCQPSWAFSLHWVFCTPNENHQNEPSAILQMSHLPTHALSPPPDKIASNLFPSTRGIEKWKKIDLELTVTSYMYHHTCIGCHFSLLTSSEVDNSLSSLSSNFVLLEVAAPSLGLGSLISVFSLVSPNNSSDRH